MASDIRGYLDEDLTVPYPVLAEFAVLTGSVEATRKRILKAITLRV